MNKRKIERCLQGSSQMCAILMSQIFWFDARVSYKYDRMSENSAKGALKNYFNVQLLTQVLQECYTVNFWALKMMMAKKVKGRSC